MAELFGACTGGAVLTAWALHLGATTFTIGLLAALPLAAQVLQLPAAWLTLTFGPKAVAIAAIGASRLLWLPLVALPFVELPLPTALQAKVSEGTEVFGAPAGYSDLVDHEANFFNAVRSRKKVVENEEFGNNAAIGCHLANHSYFKELAAVWDAAGKKIKT